MKSILLVVLLKKEQQDDSQQGRDGDGGEDAQERCIAGLHRMAVVVVRPGRDAGRGGRCVPAGIVRL
jgi:hypothetical protein